MQSRIQIVTAVVLAIVVSVMPDPAHAADPAKVEQLLTVLNLDQQRAKMVQLTQASVERDFVASATRQGVTAAQIERGRPALDALKNDVAEAFSWDYFKPRLMQIYQQELSDDEVDAAIAFFATPQGQALLVKMPMLLQRGREIGRQRAQEINPKIDAAIVAAVEKLRDEPASETPQNVQQPMPEDKPVAGKANVQTVK